MVPLPVSLISKPIFPLLIKMLPAIGNFLSPTLNNKHTVSLYFCIKFSADEKVFAVSVAGSLYVFFCAGSGGGAMLYLYQDRPANGRKTGQGIKWCHHLPGGRSFINYRFYRLPLVET